MEVASAWNKTLACVECGSWDARWTSRFAGHPVSHKGDLALWCPTCSHVFDVTLSDVEARVRMSPDDINWRKRREVWHVSGRDWWDKCPGDIYVHVGPEEVPRWLERVRRDMDEEIQDPVLYRLKVAGNMPKRLVADKGDWWYDRRVAYVQGYERPGAVCLLLPKRDLELLEKVEI